MNAPLHLSRTEGRIVKTIVSIEAINLSLYIINKLTNPAIGNHRSSLTPEKTETKVIVDDSY